MPIRNVNVDDADQFDQHRKQQKISNQEFQEIQKEFQASALGRGIRNNGIFVTHSFSG